MLVQPQFETEAILEEALARRNIYVERGIDLEDISLNNNVTQIRLKDGEQKIAQTDFDGIVIGSDGHKSKVRESL